MNILMILFLFASCLNSWSHHNDYGEHRGDSNYNVKEVQKIGGTSLGSEYIYLGMGSMFDSPAYNNRNISNKGGWNLSGADLSYYNFYSSSFSNIDMSNANLDNANLQYSSFNNVNLSGVSLGASLYDSSFINVNFSGARFSSGFMGPDIRLSEFINCNFSNANISNINFGNAAVFSNNISGDLVHNWTNPNIGFGGGMGTSLPIDYQIFNGYLVGPNANLSNADLSGVNFYQVVDETGFSPDGPEYVDLNPNFNNVNMDYANLSGADIRDVDLSLVKSFVGVKGSSVSHNVNTLLPVGYTIINDNIVGSDVDLSNADLSNIDLSGLDLSEVNFTGADLTGASLTGCNVTNANFTNAKLVNVQMEGIQMNPQFVSYLNIFAEYESSIAAMITTNDAIAIISDLRVGSQTFGVSNGNAKIRMFVDESSDLTSTWSNTQHVLELDIPADADTKFYRFRMD